MTAPEIAALILSVIAFLLLIISAQMSAANKKLEKLNDRLQVFWEEYVRKGGARRNDDY